MTTTRIQAAGSPTTKTPERRLKMAVAGLSAGAVGVARAIDNAPYLELVAAADIRKPALDDFERRYHGRVYDSVEKLCNDPDVEVVWVATPNQFHAEHTIMAAEHGKHVVVEKPMALDLQEAEKMVEAADRNKVNLLYGPTPSLMTGLKAMRRVISSGQLGKVCAINCWSYVDWMFRPRLPQELDVKFGGGTPYRSGPNQFDAVRLMGGGMVRSVRGQVLDYIPYRSSQGYYVAYLEFEDGTPATVVKNGYGYFLTTELVPWAGETRPGERAMQLRKSLRDGAAVDEVSAMESMRFGGQAEAEQSGRPGGNAPAPTGFQAEAGILVVSCEKGDIRQAPGGLYVYDDDGQHLIAVEGFQSELIGGLEEMYQAVTQKRPVHHDGRWGMATLEVILAMMESAKKRREIRLHYQCPSWE